MQIIDGAKLVEKLRLIATCWSISPFVSKEKHNGAVDMLREVEKEEKKAPTLTPPEIVYCQDCVYLEDGCVSWCDKWKHTCPDDSEFFCKFGRKKDENTTD